MEKLKNKIQKEIRHILHLIMNFFREGTSESISRIESLALFIITTIFLFNNQHIVLIFPEVQKFILYLYTLALGFKGASKLVEKINININK